MADGSVHAALSRGGGSLTRGLGATVTVRHGLNRFKNFKRFENVQNFPNFDRSKFDLIEL
jgi:hypothetical protein